MRTTKFNFARTKYEIEQINDIMNFVFAGNAIFTLESKKTNNHYTFKVIQLKENSNKFWVYVLRGPDNKTSYTYLGMIVNMEFSLTKGSHYTNESTCFKAFEIFFNNLKVLHIHTQMGFYHMGICGKCGRPLTVPSSIERGIGPICSNIKSISLQKKYKNFNFN
jgi:hypothetical protein